ncbi:MAG: dihydrofolate reductase [Flavobacterium sp.]|jgi:dihydrofolate reductase
MITLIAAIGTNNELGKNNELLWHLPKDFKRFKELTSHHTIIMGRKTFESLPGILPNRKHIIISRNKNLEILDTTIVYSLNEALEITKNENIFIIGGGQIYKESIEIADFLEITRVEVSIEADTFFPEIDESKWELIHQELNFKDEKHPYNFNFETYKKR